MKRKTIWNVVPKDYKSIVKGKKYVLARKIGGGSVLVPVGSKAARRTWGKYL